MVKQPTKKQLEYAASLGIDTRGKSFRVVAAEITDALEIEAQNSICRLKLAPGVRVRYIGPRDDLPSQLVVSSLSTNGFVYFRGTPKYCRPWNVEPVKPK